SGVSFTDTQEKGPFKSWKHRHSVQPLGDGTSSYTDDIRYELPLQPFSSIAQGLVESKLRALFEYRHRIVANDLSLHDRYASPSLRFAVSGASGSIGSQLVPFLRAGGHQVQTLVRRPPVSDEETFWDPATGDIDKASLEDIDVVIHLAGASILRPWTKSGKKLLYNSRIDGTRLLASTLASLKSKPHTFISASAIGIYGDRGAERIEESATTTSDTFLGALSIDWEHAANPAIEAGIRTVFPRIGVVISGRGGALDLVAKQFKIGLGGVPGNPDNFVSWISMDDVVGSLYHCALKQEVSGPVNITAPEPVDWRSLARTLGDVMHRPSFWRMPESVLSTFGGQFAKEVILSSARVIPGTLTGSGYRFLIPNLADTLRHQLGY
ncbi:MAG: TIGR01777 family protein, partial [Rhodothermales bacterium]|nr:TIGR01777 family protein [Rhodothermales bacterium]